MQGLQGFKDQQTPPVSAAWLNQVDQYINLSSAVSVLAFASNPIAVQNGTADVAPALTAMYNSGTTNWIIPMGNYIQNTPVTIPAGLVDCTLWCYGAITAGPGWTAVGGNNYLLTTLSPRIDFYGLLLDGGISGGASGTSCLADGFTSLGGGRIRIFNPKIQHFPNKGMAIAGTAGDTYIVCPQVQQWNNGDPAWNTDANFTARGISIERPDIFVSGGYSRWSKYPAYFTSTSQGRLDNGFHPYNGRSAGNPMVNPVIVYIEAGASNVKLNNCYLDNGYVECFSYFVNILDPTLLQTTSSTLTADSTGNIHMVRVYPNQVGDHPYGFQFRAKSGGLQPGTLPLGFVTTGGGNTWAGSFAKLDTSIAGNDFQSLVAEDGIVHVDTRIDNAHGTVEYIKEGAQIYFNYTVGGGTTSSRFIDTPIGGPNKETLNFDTVLLAPVTGTIAKFQFATANSSFYVDTSIDNSIIVHAGGTDRWSFAAGGGLVPVTDALYNLGNATNRISIAYFKPQAGVGTPFLQVDGCAQAAAFAADGTVLYVKVDGVVKKIQLGT